MNRIIKSFSICCMSLCILLTICCTSMQFSAASASVSQDVEISSKSALLFDTASGQTLFAKQEKEHLPVASMVKMMTILLTLEEIDSGSLLLDSQVVTSENASGMGGSQVFIDPFVAYSAEDLLKSVIISSANDASVALAEHICGSEKAFVGKMNARAKELGMQDTHYSNCTGLPAPEQYSCAYDSAILLGQVMKHDIYHNFSTIWMDTLTHPSGRKTELVNTNRLIRYYDGCDGGKTGSTNEAGCCLTASAKRGDMRLIAVIIGAKNSQTRFNETSALFNFGFANFENINILPEFKAVGSVAVDKGKQEQVDIFALEGYTILARKGEKNIPQVQLDLPSSVKAPCKKGNVVGKAVICDDGNVIKEIDLVLGQDIESLSYKDCIEHIAQAW